MRSRRKPQRRSTGTTNLRALALRTEAATHTIVQRAFLNVSYTPLSGFNSTTQDFILATTSGGLLWSQGGAAWTQVSYANGAAATSLFKEYRIREFNIDVYFTSSTNPEPTGAGATVTLPVIMSVIDEEDDASLTSSANALSYANMKVMQLGTSTNGRPISLLHRRPPSFVSMETSASFAGTLVAAGMSRDKWISGNATNIVHGFHKFWGAATGINPNWIVGYFMFLGTCVIEYRGIE
jgi:hypothetical protein